MRKRMGWTMLLLAGLGTGQSGLAMMMGGGGGGGPRMSRGYLGVDVHDVGDDEVAGLKLKDSRGAEIVRVDHDGPAGTAGLHERDVVLTVNGQSIEDEEQMRRMLHETPSGRTLVLGISRDGQAMTLTALMGNREEVERQAWQRHLSGPEVGPAAGPVVMAADGAAPEVATGRSDAGVRGMGFFHSNGSAGMGAGRGAERGLLAGASGTGALLEALSPQLAEFFGAPNGAGLLVRSVASNSPAAEGGMKAGDVVVRVNQVAVVTSTDWTKMARESKGRPVSVVIMREKHEQTLTITPDGKHRSRLELPVVGVEGIAGIRRAPAELAEVGVWVDRRLRERRTEARMCVASMSGPGGLL